MASLDPVDAVADLEPGFVRECGTNFGGDPDIHGFGDGDVALNLTVWESLRALRAFAYSNRAHLGVLRRRREWFERLRVYLALWWVPAGHRRRRGGRGAAGAPRTPRADPGRISKLREHFPPPGAGAGEVLVDDRELCPAG